MVAQRRRDTGPELACRRRLHALGYRYRVDFALPGSRRRGDLVFTRRRVVVFVDGCFWHGCPLHGTLPRQNAEWWADKLQANARRDRDTDAKLAAAGWQVVRVWEHEAPDEAVARIVAALREGGAVDRPADAGDPVSRTRATACPARAAPPPPGPPAAGRG